jgi:glutaredoxin
MKAILVLALILLPLAADAQTNVYRWVDKDGKVHFSDTPPPPEVKIVTQKRVGGGGGDASNLPYATQVAMQKFPVTIYTAPECGDLCNRGRDLLVRRGIPFSERDPQNKPADAAALKALIGSLEVPVLVIGESRVKGFEEGMWNSALDTAGYPRTAIPGARPPAQAAVKPAPPPVPPPAPPAQDAPPPADASPPQEPPK